MVEAAVKRFGRVDILVNNAGRARGGLVSRMSDEDWDAVFAVNVRGTFLCSRAVLAAHDPAALRRHHQHGVRARACDAPPGAAAYGASKAAVIHFTKRWRWRSRGTASASTPSRPASPTRRSGAQFRSEEDIAEAFRTGQVGQPDDLVPTVVFLCSDAAREHHPASPSTA